MVSNATLHSIALLLETPHHIIISWMHNMQNVSQNGRFQVMITEDGRNHNNSTLAINSLTATDSGNVRCVADNGFGHVSADTNLSVLSKYFCYEDCMSNVMFGLSALLQVNECLSTSMQICTLR